MLGGGGRKRESHYSTEQRQVEDYRWLPLCLSMFSGSFQCNFLPLSTGTQPAKGQNEAWSHVVDEEGKAEALWTCRQ